MRHYYIYYRVPSDSQMELKERVSSMQTHLKCQTGVTGHLLIRHDDPAVWMEVYDKVSDEKSFEAALAAAVEKFEIEIFLDANQLRHMECFETLSPN